MHPRQTHKFSLTTPVCKQNGSGRLVSDTRLSFDDYRNHCHVEKRAAQRYAGWIPQFSKSDGAAAGVSAAGELNNSRTAAKCQLANGLENNLAELKRITADGKFIQLASRSLDNLPAAEQEMVRRHVFCVDRAGGWLELHVTRGLPELATWIFVTASC